MKLHIAKILYLLLIFVGCSDLGNEPPSTFYEDEIREAFFRYQFTHNYSGIQQRAAFYALASADLAWLPVSPPFPPHPSFRNPRNFSDDFMKRFAYNDPEVKKYSECFIGQDSIGEYTVWDQSRSKRGLLFRVSEIAWTNNNHVQVYGGYYENPLSFSYEIYFMAGEKQHWVVDSTTALIIGRVAPSARRLDAHLTRRLS